MNEHIFFQGDMLKIAIKHKTTKRYEMKKVIIIDYGSGNLHSIAKAVEKSAEGKNIQIQLTDKSDDINDASHIILPGVGAFADCLHGLESIANMKESLEDAVIKEKKPFLGICVGMQMLAQEGLENGAHKGLGWIKGTVKPIPQNDLKIPHMGWNELNIKKDHKILKGIKDKEHVYFVHSYYFDCTHVDNIISSTNYGVEVPAIIAQDNIIAAQFHPEKSHNAGLKIISNFLDM